MTLLILPAIMVYMNISYLRLLISAQRITVAIYLNNNVGIKLATNAAPTTPSVDISDLVSNAVINFSTGPAFAQAFLIDSGILGTNVLADSAAVIVDVSNQINYIQTQSGRSALADLFQTGTCTLRIVDQNGDFNPTNPSGPYYGLLTPMKKVQITATFNNVTYPIFSGFITSYVNTQPKDATEVAYTTIQAVDAMRLAYNAQISTVTGATAGDLSGTRINEILDQIGWPATMRQIDAGQTTLQADPGTARTALGAMQTVAQSEYGAIYVGFATSAAANDYYEIAYQNINGHATVLAEAASGNIPAIPSVIATIPEGTTQFICGLASVAPLVISGGVIITVSQECGCRE